MFSPVVKHSSIRVILAIVAIRNLELEQLDVKTIFIHGGLEKDILMCQPEGFEKKGEEKKICLLQRSLYGLKQSPRQWYRRFDKFMINLCFSRSKHDSCVYFNKLEDKYFIYLLIYVDDMLIACRHKKEILNLRNLLSAEFEMKDLGPTKRILGMGLFRGKERGKLTISQ